MVFRSSMSTRTGLSSAWDSWCVCLCDLLWFNKHVLISPCISLI
jgi:hypothetical protein